MFLRRDDCETIQCPPAHDTPGLLPSAARCSPGKEPTAKYVMEKLDLIKEVERVDTSKAWSFGERHARGRVSNP